MQRAGWSGGSRAPLWHSTTARRRHTSRSRPPVLLAHGTDDPMVPFDSMAQAEAALKLARVPVETLACVGIGHSIDPEGLERGGRFLAEVLSAPRP